MKNLIRHILKEETNKSINLFTNLYDIEENASSYRGETKLKGYLIPLEDIERYKL